MNLQFTDPYTVFQIHMILILDSAKESYKEVQLLSAIAAMEANVLIFFITWAKLIIMILFNYCNFETGEAFLFETM